jgi:signal transduction histidine kinase
LLSEVELDPIADDHTKIWTIEECQIMKDHSQIAQDLTDSELESVIVQNLRMSGEIIAQILIGFRDAEAVTAEDVEFVGRIGHHLIPALENARQTASLRQLQQQLLGHNEQLAQMQDVTEYAEGDLRLSNKRLGEANESKSQFLAEVAHEFKTPLTVIIGYANLLSESTAELGEEQQSFARSIEKSAQQLTSLISDLGDISKIESGQFTSSKSLNDISDGVKQIVDGMRISNPAFRDRLECTGFHIKNNIVGDPSRLGQVFTNLITNALKYSPTDQPVSISIESNNDKVVITVTDKGIGISEDDLSKLFTPYFRSSNPDALKRDGTGLGLFLSKSIVEEHQGEISVSSTPGSGSAFSVELPLARGMRDTEAA